VIDICHVTAKRKHHSQTQSRHYTAKRGIYVSYTQNERRHLQETVTWERHVTVKVDMSFTVTVSYERQVRLHPKRGTCYLLRQPHARDTSLQERHVISETDI